MRRFEKPLISEFRRPLLEMLAHLKSPVGLWLPPSPWCEVEACYKKHLFHGIYFAGLYKTIIYLVSGIHVHFLTHVIAQSKVTVDLPIMTTIMKVMLRWWWWWWWRDDDEGGNDAVLVDALPKEIDGIFSSSISHCCNAVPKNSVAEWKWKKSQFLQFRTHFCRNCKTFCTLKGVQQT